MFLELGKSGMQGGSTDLEVASDALTDTRAYRGALLDPKVTHLASVRTGPRNTVYARAPLRLGLAGGGTDVSPYADRYGGAVMNATIDRYVYANVGFLPGNEVALESHDLGISLTLPTETPFPTTGDLNLHKAIYNRVVRDFCGGRPIPLRISTYSEAPAGSGLGASSTLIVAVLQALTELLGLPIGDYDIAHLAFEIERRDLALAGGRQDQYAAAFGGFNFIEFRENDTVIVKPLRVKREVVMSLETQTILCFTGVSRNSANVISEQVRNVENGSGRSIEAMHQLKKSAVDMKDALLRGNLSDVARAMKAGWISKREMASSISNGSIETALETALSEGAIAGKVSGAGGGGFIMLLVPIERRRAVLAALAGKGLGAEAVRYTMQGATAWRA